jgi:hypothetical protein
MPVERISDKTEQIINDYIKTKILQDDKRFKNPMKLTFDKVIQMIFDDLLSNTLMEIVNEDFEELRKQNLRLADLYATLFKKVKQEMSIKLKPEDTPEALEREYNQLQEKIKSRNTQQKNKTP